MPYLKHYGEKMMSKIVSLLLAFLLLSSCAHHRKKSSPEVEQAAADICSQLSGLRLDYTSRFESKLLTGLPPVKMEALFDKYAAEYGKCAEIYSIEVGEPNQFILKTRKDLLLKVLVGLDSESHKIDALWFKGEVFEREDFDQSSQYVFNALKSGEIIDYENHFTKKFVSTVPLKEMNQVFSSIKNQYGPAQSFVVKMDDGVDTEMITLHQKGIKLKFLLNLTREDNALKLGGLRYFGVDYKVPEYSDLTEIDRDLARLGQKPTIYFSELGKQDIYQSNASKVQSLGSIFKLFVLATLQEKVRTKRLKWDKPIVVSDRLKSLPSGRMQDLKEGTEVKLSDVALSMISISDNTATDHLINLLGRHEIERFMSRSGFMKAKQRNAPFLKTMDLFRVRAFFSDKDYERYRSSGRKTKATMLASLESKTLDETMSALSEWSEPKAISSIEWFATPREICRLYEWFTKHADATTKKILSANTPFIEKSKLGIAFAGYKGGSEPGVLEMAYWLQGTNGKNYCLYLGVNDEAKSIDENAFFSFTEGAINYLIPTYVEKK